uniref:sce7726 family protein n=1 Tax=Sphingomonas bacterium TaxID=1895847 RepID=UPI0026074ED5|nr:sce7726 family protein [Sphingomonas bacterium]
MGAPLKDRDVRSAAHRQLLRHARSCPDTLVLDELGVAHGACRMDIAVINGHIRGYEIKAEADTLDRLPRQVAAYGDIVDYATLIVDQRHLAAALPLLPCWWGILVATRSSTGDVRFRRIRAERYNWSADSMTLARLLWRPEAAALLRARGHDEKSLRANRATLYARLITEMPRRELSAAVRQTLKARTGWRDHARPL